MGRLCQDHAVCRFVTVGSGCGAIVGDGLGDVRWPLGRRFKIAVCGQISLDSKIVVAQLRHDRRL